MGNQFGATVRNLRQAKKLLQRQVANHLDMDTPMLSKIERGERRAKKEQVLLFADILQTNRHYLLTLWLADQITSIVQDEDLALKAIQVAEEEVKYNLTKKTSLSRSKKKRKR